MTSFIEETETVVSAKTNSLWVERYRPNKLEEYIGNPVLKKKIEQYIKENDVPHVLLYGNAGGGKTTLAKLIASNIKCDKLYINASDENSVDTVRTKIKSFASTMGFNSLKIVILDEADYITPAGQAALRNLMESFSNTTRFILTCNFHERIIDPIASRCQSFEIFPPSKKDVAIQLVNILTKEGVSFEKESIALIVNSHYPDIRACINTAQQGVSDGVLSVNKDSVIEGDLKAKIVAEFKNTSRKDAYKNIRQLLADNSIHDFSDFYTVLYERLEEFAPNNVASVITILADHQFMDVNVVDKEINFMAAVVKILRELK